MNDITKRLRHLVEVYQMKVLVNDLGENDTVPDLLKRGYCEILPLNSTVKNGEANTEINQHQCIEGNPFIIRFKITKT